MVNDMRSLADSIQAVCNAMAESDSAPKEVPATKTETANGPKKILSDCSIFRLSFSKRLTIVQSEKGVCGPSQLITQTSITTSPSGDVFMRI